MFFFVEACLILPKGSYTVNKGTNDTKSTLTIKENSIKLKKVENSIKKVLFEVQMS
jgi:hypothetical protein